jgi:phage tail-like protein
MRPEGPTFWLLNGKTQKQTGWPTATTRCISVGRDSDIRLTAGLGGPLALTSDSVGELTLPRGMALDIRGIVYILGGKGSWIKRFDPKRRGFLPLPTVGGLGSESRQFNQARNIAIVKHNLYVADPCNRRVQVFDVKSLALRHIWEAGGILGIDWEPYDVTAQASTAYVLDRWHGRVYRHQPGTDALRLVVDEPTKHNRWSRVVVDREGRVYLLAHPDDLGWEEDNPDSEQPQQGYLDEYDAQGKYIGRVEDAGDIRDRFDVPPIRLDHKGRFFLPEKLVGPGFLRESDIRDPACLARRLKRAGDAVSRYLIERLSSKARGLLNRYEADVPPDEALRAALLSELNRIIEVERLYLNEPFKSSVWPETAQRLIKQDPQGRASIQLNRLLLEAAYPRELAPGCWTWLYGPPAQVDPPAPDVPLTLHPGLTKSGLIFDLEGQPARVAEAEPMGPRIYATEGTWYSEALDSKTYDCQWHRIELELSSLPAGTKLVVSTYTDDRPRLNADIQDLRDHLWDTKFAIVGRMQPPPNPGNGQNKGRKESSDQEKDNVKKEFLIQSQEGQYLWLKIELSGDGYATPAITSIRVHYPRQSYLEELPAVYSADEESRRFLERFLSIFQTEWDDLERRIDDIARYFDPTAVPEGEFLEYLASWLALPLEGAWSQEQKRVLLMAAPQIIPRRGTMDGLRRYLQVYLQNIADLTQTEQPGYPRIVEGFRERQHFMLSIKDSANLGRGVPLWSPAVVGRLQLDEFAREGEVRLVSTGDPERDLFHEFAHRFRVFVPSAWIKTDADERMLRRALDDEKPAHTRYDLCLVEPRFRVGLQSTVGLDTIIGDYPVARLSCPHDTQAPPSRPPRHRLGYDTILAAGPSKEAGLRLTPGTQVGRNTVLI